tara:strand:+ start:140 stop:703 length:564 start_codon:yes stop_codon:yes gene_type:complete
MKCKKVQLILFILFPTFIFSQEIIKNVILYDNFGWSRNQQYEKGKGPFSRELIKEELKIHSVKYINHYLKYDDRIELHKVEYFSRNGILLRTENYISGLLEGKVTEIDENGNILIEENYQNGELIGNRKVFEYYDNGNIKSEQIYRDQIREDVWIDYYKNGKIKYKRLYENGEVIEKIILPDPKRSN